MSSGITVKVNTTPRPYGTTDKRYDNVVAPVFLVMWEDKDGVIHEDVVRTTETMCAGKFLKQVGAKPDFIIEPIGYARL